MPKGVYERTEQGRKNLSLSLVGRKLSDEHRAKMIGRIPTNAFPCGHVPFNKKDWTIIDSIIIENYPILGSIETAKKLCITRNAVCIRASKIGVKFVGDRKLTKESRDKISCALKKVYKNNKWRLNLSLSLKGRKHSSERKKAIIEGIIRSRKEKRIMTMPENKVQELLSFMFDVYNPFIFTGNRKFWITLHNGKQRNPDFIDVKQKKIIEVFGRYWHRHESEIEVINHYKMSGWECLVVWEDEIDINLPDRIMKFSYPYEYEEELRRTNTW
jgi:G:T-mismatch repair DNA endonuclease (very short patch repair protein)